MAVQGSVVLVRSGQSGVWMGIFESQEADRVFLKEARKIWYWRGANTTSDLAIGGCDPATSRVAPPVDVQVLGVCEVIDATSEAWERVRSCKWTP